MSYLTYYNPETGGIYQGEIIGNYGDKLDSLWNESMNNFDPYTRFSIDFSFLFQYRNEIGEWINYYIVKSYSESTETNLTVYVDHRLIQYADDYLESPFSFDDPDEIQPNLKCQFIIESPITPIDSNSQELLPLFQVYGFCENIFTICNYKDIKEEYLNLCNYITELYPDVNVFPYDYLKNKDILYDSFTNENFNFILVDGFLNDEDLSTEDTRIFNYFLVPEKLFCSIDEDSLQFDYLYPELIMEGRQVANILKTYISANKILNDFFHPKNKLKLFQINTSDDLSTLFNGINLVNEEIIYKENDLTCILMDSINPYTLPNNKFFGFSDHYLSISNDIYERLFLLMIFKMYELEENVYIDMVQIERFILHSVAEGKSPNCLLACLKLPNSSRSGLKIESKKPYYVYTPYDQIESQKTRSVTIDSSAENSEKYLKTKLEQSNVKFLDPIMGFNYNILKT